MARLRPQRQADSPFRAALLDALARNEVSLTEACSRAGVSRSIVRKWWTGEAVPRRPNLERLASVLDAPEFFESIVVREGTSVGRAELISVTCEECGESEEWPARRVAQSLQRGSFPGARVDFDLGAGRYPRCARCAHRANANAKLIQPLRKRHGRRFFKQRGRRLGEATRDSGLLAEIRPQAWAAIRGRKQTDDQIKNAAASKLKPRLSGQFGLCRACGLLCYNQWPVCRLCRTQCDVHSVDLREPVESHARCLSAWRRDQQKWGGGKDGYPSRSRGRRPSAADLMLSYEMVVRHYAWSRKKQTVEAIAEYFNLPVDTVKSKMRRFLDLLPADDRGGAWLLRRSELLRFAAER